MVHPAVVELAEPRGILRYADAEPAALVEVDPLLEGTAAPLAHLVEEASDGPGVAPELAHVPLELVDLLDHVDRDHDLVLFELLDGPGIVEEHVRVQDVDLSGHLVSAAS